MAEVLGSSFAQQTPRGDTGQNTTLELWFSCDNVLQGDTQQQTTSPILGKTLCYVGLVLRWYKTFFRDRHHSAAGLSFSAAVVFFDQTFKTLVFWIIIQEKFQVQVSYRKLQTDEDAVVVGGSDVSSWRSSLTCGFDFVL